MSTARPFFVRRLTLGAFGKVALKALERLPIGDYAVGLDASEQHLRTAVWAGRSLGRIPGWLGDEIGHGCSFAIGGTATELSVIGRGLSYWKGQCPNGRSNKRWSSGRAHTANVNSHASPLRNLSSI